MTAGVFAVSLAVALAIAPVQVPAEAPVATAEEPSEPAASTDEQASSDAAPGKGDLGDALLVEARKRYEEGADLFRERRYREAAEAYARSYAAVPVGETLYGVALSYEKAGDYVRSVDAYERYLDLPDCPAPGEHCAARRTEVEETVTSLRGKVGRISIVVDEGVELQGIEIDDRFLPPDDFPLVLAPGRYELRVRGIRRGEVRLRQVEVAAGEMTSILIPAFDAPDSPPDLEPIVDDGPSPPPPGRLTEEERRRRLRLAFYGGVGVTVASGIATGVIGGLTLQAHREYDGRCKGEGVDCTGTERPDDAARRFETLQPATNALVAVTATVGLTTVVLALFAFSGKQGAGKRASVTRVTPTPGGVRVRF